MNSALIKVTNIDVHVAERIRRHRLLVGVSMEEMAVKLGVSYQQYAKYERAVDRISARTLYVIAACLGVPVQYFYDGLRHDGTSDPTSIPFQEMLASFDARERRLISELTNAYWRIRSPSARRGIINMMQAIAESYSVVGSLPR